MRNDTGRSVEPVDRFDPATESLPALAAALRRLLADDELSAARRALVDLLDLLDEAGHAEVAEELDTLATSATTADDAALPAAVDDLLGVVAITQSG